MLEAEQEDEEDEDLKDLIGNMELGEEVAARLVSQLKQRERHISLRSRAGQLP